MDGKEILTQAVSFAGFLLGYSTLKYLFFRYILKKNVSFDDVAIKFPRNFFETVIIFILCDLFLGRIAFGTERPVIFDNQFSPAFTTSCASPTFISNHKEIFNLNNNSVKDESGDITYCLNNNRIHKFTPVFNLTESNYRSIGVGSQCLLAPQLNLVRKGK